MRIGLVTEELAQGAGSGGIGGAFHELALLLARAGHVVDVFYAPTTPGQAEPAALHGAYAARGIGLHPVPVGDWVWNAGSPEARAYAVFRHLHSLDDPYDALHFHDYKGLAHFCLAAKRQGLAFPSTTLVVGVHGPTRWALEANGHLFSHEDQLKIDFMERASIAAADVLVSPSRYMLGWLKAAGWAVPPAGRTRVIQNPCGELVRAAGQAGAPPARLRAPDEVVLFARHEARKGIVEFCDALDLLAPELAAAGTQVTFLGPLGQVNGEASLVYLAGRAGRWAFPMLMLPDLGRQEAAAYLQGNPRSVVVVPSPVENSPYTVLEAVALGKPLLTSCEGGARELLSPRAARAMTCGITGPALAAALRRVLAGGLPAPEPAVPFERTERDWLDLHEAMPAAPGRASTARIARTAAVGFAPAGVAPACVEPACAAPVRTAAARASARAAPPKVVAAITHHERPEKLLDALLSLSRQTYPNLEVVVVDDGSCSPAAVEALARMEPLLDRLGVRLLRQANLYLGAARNAAARATESEYLLFLDDDDLAFPTLVSTLVEAAENTGADVMGCLNLFMEEPRRGEAHPFPDRFPQKASYVPLGGPLSLAPVENVLGSATALIRRAAFARAGGYTELHGVGHEDYEFYVRVLQSGGTVEVCPLPLYLYEVGRPSMISRTSQHRNFRRVAGAVDLAACPGRWADLVLLGSGRRASEHGDNLRGYLHRTSPNAALLQDLAGLVPASPAYAAKAAELAQALGAPGFARALAALAARRIRQAAAAQAAQAARPDAVMDGAADGLLDAALEQLNAAPNRRVAAEARDPHILGGLIDLEMGRVTDAVACFRLSVQRERRLTRDQRRFLAALAAAPTPAPADLQPMAEALRRMSLPNLVGHGMAAPAFRILLRAGAAPLAHTVVQLVLQQDGAAYLAAHADVRDGIGSSAEAGLRHFCEFGEGEGRSGFAPSLGLVAVLQEELGVAATLASLSAAVEALKDAPLHAWAKEGTNEGAAEASAVAPALAGAA